MSRSFLIPLSKIPPEGLHFSLTPSSSKDWAHELKQVIGDNDYDITLAIHPVEGSSSYFQVTGHIKTYLNLLCSRCAIDFKHAIDKNISESIYVQPKRKKKETYVHLNPNEEEITVLNDKNFNILEFVHELIAIEEPIKPIGKESCELNDDCENFIAMQKRINMTLNENEESVPSPDTEKTHRPFSNLDKLL